MPIHIRAEPGQYGLVEYGLVQCGLVHGSLLLVRTLRLRRYERGPGPVFGRGGEPGSAGRGKSGSPGRRMGTGPGPLYRRSHEGQDREPAA